MISDAKTYGNQYPKVEHWILMGDTRTLNASITAGYEPISDSVNTHGNLVNFNLILFTHVVCSSVYKLFYTLKNLYSSRNLYLEVCNSLYLLYHRFNL